MLKQQRVVWILRECVAHRLTDQWVQSTLKDQLRVVEHNSIQVLLQQGRRPGHILTITCKSWMNREREIPAGPLTRYLLEAMHPTVFARAERRDPLPASSRNKN